MLSFSYKYQGEKPTLLRIAPEWEQSLAYASGN